MAEVAQAGHQMDLVPAVQVQVAVAARRASAQASVQEVRAVLGVEGAQEAAAQRVAQILQTHTEIKTTHRSAMTRTARLTAISP